MKSEKKWFQTLLVTAQINDSDKTIKIRLSEETNCHYYFPKYLGIPGLSVEGVWCGIRWIVMRTYSIWDNGRGGCVGDEYTAFDINSDHDRQDILNSFLINIPEVLKTINAIEEKV